MKKKPSVVTLGRSFYEKEYLQKIAKIYVDFFRQVWDKLYMNAVSVTLRYHPCKQIPENVARRRHTDKYILQKHSSYKRLI